MREVLPHFNWIMLVEILFYASRAIYLGLFKLMINIGCHGLDYFAQRDTKVMLQAVGSH